MEQQGEYVKSLARGLSVIRAFDADHSALTLSDVARATGLSRATARRFLLTLTELGYVRFDGRLFTLTPRILELGFAYLSSLTLPEVAQPHLERLAAETHESASVAVLDGPDVVYVARVATSRIMRVSINIGTRFPAHPTSMGRVLLAGLPPERLDAYLEQTALPAYTVRTITSPAALRIEVERVRARGWAMVDQEFEEGLRSMAAPVRDAAGQVVAAINLSFHASRTSADDARRDSLPLLLAAAARVEIDLRGAGTQVAPYRGAFTR